MRRLQEGRNNFIDGVSRPFKEGLLGGNVQAMVRLCCD